MNKKRWILIVVIAVFVAAAALGMVYVGSFPAEDSVVVRYRSGGAVIPMTIDHVERVREYIVDGERYQVVVDIAGAMVPEVFTPWEIVDYKLPLRSTIECVTFTDQVYHTYDPYLQGWKNEQRKATIHAYYEAYLGREPSEEEFNLALAILIQKVQLEQWKVRLEHSPEAVVYRINQWRDEPLTSTQQGRVVRLLERGETIENIVEVYTK